MDLYVFLACISTSEHCISGVRLTYLKYNKEREMYNNRSMSFTNGPLQKVFSGVGQHNVDDPHNSKTLTPSNDTTILKLGFMVKRGKYVSIGTTPKD